MLSYWLHSNFGICLCCCTVLSIHMDDQIDGKTLVGSYVCTERPGEFRWQPGSLTQVCFFANIIEVYHYGFVYAIAYKSGL